MDVRARNNIAFTGHADGPVVMLAHGFGCDQNMWRLVLPELQRQSRVLLFDHVGAGRSDLSRGTSDGTGPWTATPMTCWRSATSWTYTTWCSWDIR